MNVSFKVDKRSEVRTIELLTAVGNKDAQFAQRTAMRAARTQAAGDGAKSLAAQTQTIPKVWRPRVKAFARREREGFAHGKLWFGLRFPPASSEHKTVRQALLAKHGQAFDAEMENGHRGLFRRRGRRRLPIDELFLEIPGNVEDIALRAARDAMRGKYVKVLKKDYMRRIAKRKQRR